MGDNISSDLRDDSDGDWHDDPEGGTRYVDAESDQEDEVSGSEYIHEASRAEAMSTLQRIRNGEERLNALLRSGLIDAMAPPNDEDIPSGVFLPLSTEAGLRRAFEQSRRVSEEESRRREELERAKRAETAREMKHQNELEELRARITELERRQPARNERNCGRGSASSDEDYQPGSKRMRRPLRTPRRSEIRGGNPKMPKPGSDKASKAREPRSGRADTEDKSRAKGCSASRPSASSAQSEDANCPICLEPIVGSERGLLEPCMHARYHYECAMDLYVNHGKCCLHNPSGPITGVKKIYA